MQDPMSLGGFDLPGDEPQVSLIRQGDRVSLDVFDSPYLAEILTEDQIEVVENRELATLIIEQREIVAQGAIHAIGSLYVSSNVEFAQATGEIFGIRDSLELDEHRNLFTAFAKIMNNELPAGLIQNYRMAVSEVNKTAATDLSPKAKPPKTGERRKATFTDWLLGREVAVDDA